MCDAKVDQMIKPINCRFEGPHIGECADMKLVNNCCAQWFGLPVLIAPFKKRMVDMARGPMDAGGLPGRTGIRGSYLSIDDEKIVITILEVLVRLPTNHAPFYPKFSTRCLFQ